MDDPTTGPSDACTGAGRLSGRASGPLRCARLPVVVLDADQLPCQRIGRMGDGELETKAGIPGEHSLLVILLRLLREHRRASGHLENDETRGHEVLLLPLDEG